MIVLAQGDLRVELLDPGSLPERSFQGSRYCWGGYIWQVTDAVAGALCAGPEWPNPRPTAFNGQGLPESFRHQEFGTGRPLTVEHGSGFVVGAGDVSAGADGSFQVVRPCGWTITPSVDSCEFTTEQSARGWQIKLRRRVELRGRELISHTQIYNFGLREMPLHWFAHPFFALTAGKITATIPSGWAMPANPGFALDAAGHITQLRVFHGLTDGQFQALTLPSQASFHATVDHPRLTGIEFLADFSPAMCPVWGNGNTWSIEPYLVTSLAPGADFAWTLRYRFGAKK